LIYTRHLKFLMAHIAILLMFIQQVW